MCSSARALTSIAGAAARHHRNFGFRWEAHDGGKTITG